MIRWLSAPLISVITFVLLRDYPSYQLTATLFVAVVTWWITEPLPLVVTGLLGTVGAVFLGLISAEKAFTAYTSPTIVLFFAGFLLAKALEVNGL